MYGMVYTLSYADYDTPEEDVPSTSVEATWQIFSPDRFLQAVLEDLTSGHLVNVQGFLVPSVFTTRKKLSHESDQAWRDLSKNAIKSVS